MVIQQINIHKQFNGNNSSLNKNRRNGKKGKIWKSEATWKKGWDCMKMAMKCRKKGQSLPHHAAEILLPTVPVSRDFAILTWFMSRVKFTQRMIVCYNKSRRWCSSCLVLGQGNGTFFCHLQVCSLKMNGWLSINYLSSKLITNFEIYAAICSFGLSYKYGHEIPWFRHCVNAQQSTNKYPLKPTILMF